MKLFLDSSNLIEIEKIIVRGLVSGLTTNPTLIRSQIDSGPIEHLQKIVNILKYYGDQMPISIQVMTVDPKSMVDQALRIIEKLDYENIVIKIPCGWDEFEIIHTLSKKGIKVNCTACMTFIQAMLGAESGARYVSLFYGKMGDASLDAGNIVESVVTGLRRSEKNCELIVGSIRKPFDISEILLRGADIVTVPFKYFENLSKHEKTEEAISVFARDFLAF